MRSLHVLDAPVGARIARLRLVGVPALLDGAQNIGTCGRPMVAPTTTSLPPLGRIGVAAPYNIYHYSRHAQYTPA